jgi:hypothetical protein
VQIAMSVVAVVDDDVVFLFFTTTLTSFGFVADADACPTGRNFISLAQLW